MSEILLSNLWRAIELAMPSVERKCREAKSLEELEPWASVHKHLAHVVDDLRELHESGCL